MFLVQNFSRFIERDVLRLLLFPGQSRQKIQIVVKKGRFRSLSLVFETGQDLVCFLAGGLVHSGLFYLYLKLSYVRDIFGIHLVELTLQILHLLAYSGFPVYLLVILFLGVFGFSVHLVHLKVFIDQLLEKLRPLCHTVFREHCIALRIRAQHPGGHHNGGLAYAVPLCDEPACSLAPLKAFGKLHHCSFYRIQLSAGFLRVQIVYVVPAGNGQIDSMVAIYCYIVYIHAVCSSEHNESVGVYLCNSRAEPDRIEAV